MFCVEMALNAMTYKKYVQLRVSIVHSFPYD